jgi:hypothetical protein
VLNPSTTPWGVWTSEGSAPGIFGIRLEGQLQAPALLPSDKQPTISIGNKGYSEMVGLDNLAKKIRPRQESIRPPCYSVTPPVALTCLQKLGPNLELTDRTCTATSFRTTLTQTPQPSRLMFPDVHISSQTSHVGKFTVLNRQQETHSLLLPPCLVYSLTYFVLDDRGKAVRILAQVQDSSTL